MELRTEHTNLLASLLAEEARLDPWPKAVAVLLAQGLSPRDISRAFGESEERVLSIVQAQSVQELVAKIQAGLSYSPEQRLASALAPALDVVAASLSSAQLKQSEKVKVAQDIIDRNLGKPVQTTQSVIATVTSSTPDKVVNAQLAAMSQRLKAIEDRKNALRRVINVTPSASDIIGDQ